MSRKMTPPPDAAPNVGRAGLKMIVRVVLVEGPLGDEDEAGGDE